MAGLADSVESLETARRLLQGRWQQALESWRDGVAQEFDAQVMMPLDAQATRSEVALGRLAELIAQARRQIR